MSLLEQNNMVEQHIYYSREQAPEKIQGFSKKSLVLDPKTNNLKVNTNQANFMRTIYLGGDQTG